MKIIESDFQAWMGEIQARTEAALGRLLPPGHLAPARLHEAMRYATLGGGKRVRPLLAFAAGGGGAAAPPRPPVAGRGVEVVPAGSLGRGDPPCVGDHNPPRG